MNNEQRIKEALRRLQVEREIYLRVFNCPAQMIHNQAIEREALELSHKRLLTAKQNHLIAIRWDDITKCRCCKEEGIAELDEKYNDDKHFEILRVQTDSDSQFHNELLCDECLAYDDNMIANRDVTGRAI